MRTEFLCISVLRVALGPRVKLASCKSALNPRWFTLPIILMSAILMSAYNMQFHDKIKT